MRSEKADKLLAAAVMAQAEFWKALRALEVELGFEVDDSFGLEEETVEHLVSENQVRLERKKAIQPTLVLLRERVAYHTQRGAR